MRATAIEMRRSPASTEATSKPPRPKRWATGESTTTNAAVGPETWTREPPRRAMSAPATMAV